MSVVSQLIREYSSAHRQGEVEFRIDIPRWEILDEGYTVLWGSSGAGKSSLLRILLGFDREANFQWRWNEIDLAKLPPGERRIGVVYQSADLFPHMSVRENILFAAEARRFSKAESLERLQMLVSALRIEAILDRPAPVISGGERQRAALARAIMGKPRFLFLDEPFSALDLEHRKEARNLVQTLIEKENIPTVLVTHDPEDLKGIRGKLTELSLGHIVNEKQIG